MLDKIDRKLLALLQQDCTLSLQALAEAVNLTTTPCWKRLKRLEDDGILIGKVALLDPEKIGLGLTAFVLIKTQHHSSECIAALSRWLPKCQKCWGSGAWLVNTII
ncbi:AsnC family transcriptional regulator [Escherichia coli]|uniref:AsnC family transcriptional regulator n=1 Tax=Escherichia coli TaxID=562 RepID=A0A377F856_ECOLX|nr:AsnC family transcriptional regulator [Escherichia coli]